MLISTLFYVFGTILVLSAVGVIGARNPVFSALALVMCFVTSAAIWLLIEAEFVASVLEGQLAHVVEVDHLAGMLGVVRARRHTVGHEVPPFRGDRSG